MDDLKMHTLDLAALFPNAVTEKITGYDGSDKAIIERAVDIEVLRQEISAQVALGDVSDPDIHGVQIRETIRSHFEKECELYGKSIKCLFPFFIDEVAKCRFQQLWNLIKCKYAYTVEFDSDELLRKAAAHIDQNMFVTQLQYTVTTGCQEEDMSAEHIESGTAFVKSKTKTANIKRTESSHVTYDIIGRRAEGAKLTRRSASKILAGITPRVFDMFRSNPEEFIVKAVKLINEKKADMIVKHITYRPTGDTYGSEVFTADKNSKFSNLCKAKKNVHDYVVIDGYARDGQSVESRMAEAMDKAEEVCIYAKLPKGFSIPTPVGNYFPDWAIAFNKGSVTHIFCIAETNGTKDASQLRQSDYDKIKCAETLFAGLSKHDIVYHKVDQLPEAA